MTEELVSRAEKVINHLDGQASKDDDVFAKEALYVVKNLLLTLREREKRYEILYFDRLGEQERVRKGRAARFVAALEECCDTQEESYGY